MASERILLTNLKNVTLHFDRFGLDALERLASRREDSPGAVVRTAAVYYLADRESARPGWRAPRFIREPQSLSTGEFDVDDETWLALECEAERQGIATGQLAEHAFLYFLADLDSGRLADRIDAALDDA